MLLQETHSTPGSTLTFVAPEGTRVRWSSCSQRQAGVALWIKEDFLAKFNRLETKDWEELVPGRAAVLRLNGSNGSLDIFVVYSPM